MILIAEDESKIAALMADYLNAAGFQTHIVAQGEVVLATVATLQPELVLLDVMLPGKDGLGICRELRHTNDVPVIMITARVEEIDRLIGLESGADDYICKPFSPREVVARVKAILRRARSTVEVVPLFPAGLRLDATAHTATLDNTPLHLTPVEFRLLYALWREPGKILSRDTLMDVVYADKRVVTDRTVDTHVKNVRRKIEALRPGDTSIRSIYGAGYRLDL
jgi:two-component system response regulator BaeR